MRSKVARALAILTLAAVAAGQVRAAPLEWEEAAADGNRFENHVAVTLWSASDAETGLAFATIPESLGSVRVETPVRKEQGGFRLLSRRLVRRAAGHVCVSEYALGRPRHPPPGLLLRPPRPLRSIDDIFVAAPRADRRPQRRARPDFDRDGRRHPGPQSR
jgi:hypothetical protein